MSSSSLRPRSFPLVVAAPSGAGKTSIAQSLVQRHEDVVFSVSATTREPRQYERSGRHYTFVPLPEFERMVRDGELVEWAVVHGHRYGTPAEGVKRALENGAIPVLDIDVQGARQIRRAFPEAVLVYILPPSAAELLRRLSGRRSETDTGVLSRLRNAREELRAAPEFDYIVVNESLETAVAALEAIVQAERARAARSVGLDLTVDALIHELDTILKENS